MLAARTAPESAAAPPPLEQQPPQQQHQPMAPQQQRLLERAACAYQRCYCEENALLLSKQLAAQGAAPAGALYVVFVSNARRQVPLWAQRAAREGDGGLLVWDYHVRGAPRRVFVAPLGAA